MSASIIRRYALAAAFGVALAGQAAPFAFAQSGDVTVTPFASQQQEQLAKNPLTAQDSNREVPWVSDQRNGAGEIIDPTYGIPMPGQNQYPD
jgi:hypothetical protein